MPDILCELLTDGYFTVNKKLISSKRSQAREGQEGMYWEGHNIPAGLVICSWLCNFSTHKPLITEGRHCTLQRTELIAQSG